MACALAQNGDVEQREPYGLRIGVRRDDGSPLHIDVVMTPADWDDLVAVRHGSLGLALEYVRRVVAEQARDKTHLVFRSYELIPSAAPELPADPDLLEMQALAGEDGIVPGGRWFANPQA